MLDGGAGADRLSGGPATTRQTITRLRPGVFVSLSDGQAVFGGDAEGDLLNGHREPLAVSLRRSSDRQRRQQRAHAALRATTRCDGGGGADLLDGEGGKDTLTGGSGADVFSVLLHLVRRFARFGECRYHHRFRLGPRVTRSTVTLADLGGLRLVSSSATVQFTDRAPGPLIRRGRPTMVEASVGDASVGTTSNSRASTRCASDFILCHSRRHARSTARAGGCPPVPSGAKCRPSARWFVVPASRLSYISPRLGVVRRRRHVTPAPCVFRQGP